MNIVILDDEIYLAQKIVSRLLDEGHNCESFSSAHEVIANKKKYDAVLLSTNLASSECDEIIRYYKNSIVILLVSYISDATVTKPITLGAKDYVVKPFIMDELIRKIHHFQEHNSLKQQLQLYKNYFDFSFKDIQCEQECQKPLPLLIQTNTQKFADKLLFCFAQKLKKEVVFISLSDTNWQEKIEKNSNKLLFCTQYHGLKKSQKEILHSIIEHKDVLVCSMEDETDFPYACVQFKSENQILSNDNIMTINEYVKLMVLSFESKYPDTELSKKLGISRKSLWEKRKKLGIEKTKGK